MTEMIRVRVLTTAAGPDFQLHPGSETDLPREQAKAMIAGGFAERVAEEEPETVATAEADVEAPAEAEPEEGDAMPVETATGQPQRSEETNDLIAAELAGREAAGRGAPRSSNPEDGRSAKGRAWNRGYDSLGAPDRG